MRLVLSAGFHLEVGLVFTALLIYNLKNTAHPPAVGNAPPPAQKEPRSVPHTARASGRLDSVLVSDLHARPQHRGGGAVLLG